MSTKKTTADAAYEWLGTNPGFHNLDDLTAALPNVKQPTLVKALSNLVDNNQIRVVTIDDSPAWTADEETEDPASAPDADATGSNSEADGGEAENSTETEDQTETAAIAVGPNPQVIAIAFVLSRAAAGLTPAAIADGSGIGVDAVWPILAAMHTAGAAECDREFFLDPEAVWTVGTADPMTVNLAAAPDTVRCPMCGNQAPVPGSKSARKRANGGISRATGQYEPVRDMGAQVEAWLKRHPDQDVTPGQISKALKEETGHPNPNAFSSGAIRNVLFKLTNQGELRQVIEARQLTFHTPETDSRS